MPGVAPAISIVQGQPLGLATAAASVVIGLEARPIQVEVCSSRGPSFFQLVGLAEAAVRESRVRVASALAGLDVLLDEYAVTVNLAPADLRKAGATLDLAIALGVLAAIGKLAPRALEGTLLLGEVGLDGTLRPVRGLLPQLDGARQRGLRRAIVPLTNAREAGIATGLDPAIAAKVAIETTLGAARLLARTGESPEVLRDKVTSPNGTTYAGLQILAAKNFRETIKETIAAATRRAGELSQD